MLELVVSEKLYDSLPEKAVLLAKREIVKPDSPVVDMGSVIRYWGGSKNVSIETHLQSGFIGEKNLDAYVRGLQLPSFLHPSFKKEGIEYRFKARKNKSGEDEDSFHFIGGCCLELRADFPAKNYDKFDALLNQYASVVNELYSAMYGDKKSPTMRLEFRVPEMMDARYVDCLMEDIGLGPAHNKAIGKKRPKQPTRKKGPKQAVVKERRTRRFARFEEQPPNPSSYELKDPNVHWKDIGGLYRQKRQLALLVRKYLRPKRFKRYGEDPKKRQGCLISGPVGCGKSMLMEAVATEVKKQHGDKIKIYNPTYGDITSRYRGAEAINVLNLFERLYGEMESGFWVMLALDEFQSMGRRINSPTSRDEALDQLLIEVERFNKYEKGLLIAATKEPLHTFDGSLLRPGRFNVGVEVDIPKPDEARDILKLTVWRLRSYARRHSRPFLFKSGGIDYSKIIRATVGFPSSHLVALIEDAKDRKEEQCELDGKRFTQITTDDILANVESRIIKIAETSDHEADL